MSVLDPSQLAVLRLDPTRHACVLGAPGTGKTRVLVESFDRLTGLEGWKDDDVLVLATNRQVAAGLRASLESRTQRALGGASARTGISFGLSVLSDAAATAGHAAPRLVTGTVHEEVISEVVTGVLDSADGSTGRFSALRERFSPEVLSSSVFRGELRELGRVLDDVSTDPLGFETDLRRISEAESGPDPTRAPAAEVIEHWCAVLPVLAEVQRRLVTRRPNDLTSSGALRAAAHAIREDPGIGVPRVILIDDAQELREGELALVSACVQRGSRVWVFGDPDIATGAFQGEHTRVLGDLGAEMARKITESGAPVNAATAGTLARGVIQRVVLERTHRHGARIRALTTELTGRIGASRAGEQREAEPAGPNGKIRFVEVSSLSEQLGVIAHRLRQCRLGIESESPLTWGAMAVVCRSRGEADRIARLLASQQVPTGVATGGIVLRDHPIVRGLVRLLEHVLGIASVTSADLLGLLTGVVGGLDRFSLRRLRGELRLRESRAAAEEERAPRTVDEILIAQFIDPQHDPPVDSAGGRALQRLGKCVAEASRVHAADGTAREVLWAIWEGTGLASRLQDEALSTQGMRSDEAHRMLDAVLGLFFTLQRHEELDSEQPISELLKDVLTSSVPEDTLAARSERDAVTVTTPQGVIGREFDIVCVLGPQDGDWPNLRSRGSLLGVSALERWLRGMPAETPSRKDTLHDELRIFAQACSRARREILAVAVRDEDHHPSAFFGFGAEGYRADGLPSSRLTIRGAVAELRRRLARDPDDAAAAHSLVLLCREGVPGAHPDEWYGLAEPTTRAPLVDLEGDAEASVTVRPSQVEQAERCPLDWVVSHLSGGTTSVSAQLGTLLHRGLEESRSGTPEEILKVVDEHWGELSFEADWESDAKRRLTDLMARGIADYIRDFDSSDRELVGEEVPFTLRVQRAVLHGTADRLELRTRTDGTAEVMVVDLKTGNKKPSPADAEKHAQMQAYQYGVLSNAFEVEGAEEFSESSNGGARLLYVDPTAVGSSRLSPEGHGFVEAVQAPLSPEAQEAFVERVGAVAEIMAGGQFTACVEHHCSIEHAPGGACRLHIIPAVSHG